MSTNTIEVLAKHGIDVDNNGKLLQDKSVQLYQDGHLHDFGRGGKHYFNVDDFIADRKDLHDAPVQANTALKISTPKYNVEGIYNSYRIQFEQLDNTFKAKALYELLPEPYWKDGIPKSIGYDFKNKSLTVSVFDGDVVMATTVRRSFDVKWRTYGKKTFIPTRLTGKDDVYLASGMGEIVLMELMGWDYIGLQADGMVKYLEEPSDQIQHLIVLPDNDESFMNKVDEIVSILAPKTASIVKWKYPDPRDAATAYGTPEALQQAIDEHLKTIEIVDDEVGNMIDLKHIHEPVDPVRFADKMKEVLVEYNPKFVVSKQMIDVFHSYCSTFNSIVKDNQDPDSQNKRYIIPLATGSAKSTAAKLYLGANKTTGLLVVRTARNAVEAVRDINSFARGAIARCTYSVDAKNNRPDTPERVTADELIHYPVIVLTHAMFQRLHSNDLHLEKFSRYLPHGSTELEPRAAIIIDERIDLKREESFDNQEVEDTIKIMRESMTIPEEYIESLQVINDLAFTHDNDLAQGSRFIRWKEGMINVMKSGSDIFPRLITLLKTGNTKLTHIPRIRGLRKRDSDTFAVENSIIDLLSRIHFVISGHMLLSKEGKKTIVSRVEDYSLVFGSTAILDATANVNRSYEVYMKYQPESTVMFDKPEIRNYQNATLHIAKGFKQSKTALYYEPKKKSSTNIMADTVRSATVDTVSAYLEMIYPVVKVDDNMLVVVHKDALATFKEQCRMDNITFINWGNHAGSNSWSHYNKAAIIGWFRLPQHLYANQINAGAKNYLNYEPSEAGYDADVRALGDSAISDDMVQFLNRIRSRIAIDEEGNHEPVDYYIFSDNATRSKNILARMIKEFKDMKVADWSVTPATALKKRRPKSEERANNIMAALKIEAKSKSDVMAEDIRTKLGTTKAAFKNTIATEYMQKELTYFNIKYTRLEGVSGKPSVFDLSEAKNL